MRFARSGRPRPGLRFLPALATIAAGAGGVVGVAACVDLFHSTNFETLCSNDAAGCEPPVEAAPVVTPSEAGGLSADICTWTAEQSESQAERTCAWMGACGGALPGSTLGTCVVRARSAYDCTLNPVLRPRGATEALWKCLVDVASCDAVNKCLYGDSPPTCPKVDSGLVSSCAPGNGSALVQCAPGDASVNPLAGVDPCALGGRSCISNATTAACAGTQGLFCIGNARCMGTFVSACNEPIDVGFDCSSFGGGVCVEDSAGPACAPGDDAGTCSASSKVTCDDAGVAHSCVGGREVTMNCPRFAMACVGADSGVDPLRGCFATSAAGCNPDDSCDGDDKVQSCAQGKTFAVSCASLGLGPCALASAPRALTASCTPK